MKNYQIEKEYKMMLEESKFKMIISGLNPDTVTRQNNFYYTASHNMGMRIREIDQHYYYTLKHYINGEVREYEWEIPDNNIGDPSITNLLNELHIDHPVYMGSLFTTRYIKEYPLGILCLDENEYLGKIDYELEYELKDATQDDYKTLEEFLKTYDLSYIVNTNTKYKRFKDRLKEVKE